MGVKLLESLEMQTGLPLDKRNIVQNIDQRNNINPALRYIGMEVFVADKNKKYRLEEGIENFNWIDKDTIKSSDLVTDTDHLTVTQAEKDKWSGKAERVHKHTKDDITDFPVALKNPNALTIKLNGTSQGAYDGSSVKEINITAENVGAQPKGNYAPTVHTHTKSQIIDFPTVLPNPHSLVIQANGSSLGDYDGSAGKAFNITASNVGAYTKGEVDSKLGGKANSTHSHSEYQPKGDYATTGHKHTEYLSSQGSVTVSGNLTVTGEIISNNNVTAYSDETVKKNLVLLDKSVLEKLKEVKFYNYEMINDPTERKRVGVKAQELEKLFPELVFVDSNNIKKVDYIGLNTYFNFAIQQLIRGE